MTTNIESAPSCAERAAFAVELFYDGDCPLCMREVRLLGRLDKHHRLRLTDLRHATDVEGRTYDELMERMHGRLPDGAWIDGVEVFRRAYAAVGFGWVVALTRVPGIRHLLDAAYHVFAKNRLRLTGRCEGGTCEVPLS